MVTVGAAGNFLWKKWKKGKTVGVLRILELEVTLRIVWCPSLWEAEAPDCKFREQQRECKREGNVGISIPL